MNVVGVTNDSLIGFKVHCMTEAIHDAAKLVKNLGLEVSGPRRKSNTIVLIKKHSSEMAQMTLCYNHRSVPEVGASLSHHQRGFL